MSERKVRCYKCRRTVKGISLDGRTGVYTGRCKCGKLVIIHHETYQEGNWTLWR